MTAAQSTAFDAVFEHVESLEHDHSRTPKAKRPPPTLEPEKARVAEVKKASKVVHKAKKD